MAGSALIAALESSQRLGMIGGAPIADGVRHAEQFVVGIGALGAGARILDLGSGGGLPGLVVAEALPHCRIVLLDRRQKRTDHLRRIVTGLGWDHVEVWHEDAHDTARRVASGELQPFDVVTARGFGPPTRTLRIAMELVAASGRVLISEPPEGDRWPSEVLVELGVSSTRHGTVRIFTPTGRHL